MEKGNPLIIILLGICTLLSSSKYNSIFLAGLGVVLIAYGIFMNKKYIDKLIVLIILLVLVISIILTYLQLLSPLFSGNKLTIYLLAIFVTLSYCLIIYDMTHDYKISKILEMNNINQRTKNIVFIIVSIIGVLLVFYLGFHGFI
ncbi:MAG: hypothetical protein ACC609_06405 [Methanobacterium formicicum]